MPYENKYLNLLAKEYPTVQEVSTELINLTAILNLPKGTEHFISDIHGEYETFNHFLKNGSGVTKDKIDILFKHYSEQERNTLAFFAYYPKQMLAKYEELLEPEEFNAFIKQKMLELIKLCNQLSQKYTKSKVRKMLPQAFHYIIQELLYENSKADDKQEYYSSIIEAIFLTKRQKNFLIELAYLSQRLTIDRLHIVGDIFDRGNGAHLVMNKIMMYHSIDIEWGNHDVIWMGAASGSRLSICNVLRNSAKYNLLDTLEEGYGINLLPLAQLSLKYYGDDPCDVFVPESTSMIDIDKTMLVAKMHKAISIMQFKLEKSLSDRNPDFDLGDRLLLDKIDYTNGTIELQGTVHKLRDTFFPTIDPDHPFQLLQDEIDVLNQLKRAFLNCDLLQTHIKHMFAIGQMYTIYNNNLLFHGCIPLNEKGELQSFKVDGKDYKGIGLFNVLDQKIRSAYLNRYSPNNAEKDYFVYLWQGRKSPLFGKSSMKTFERYFIEDKAVHKEVENAYFYLREDETILKNIYDEFEINFETSKIINGHVPTDISRGDSPIKANGRIYTIDGGMSKQYKAKINIGGYTLVSDSYKLFLISHDRFNSKEELIEKEQDIISLVQAEEMNENRLYIYNTNKGIRLQNRIFDLYKLLDAYRKGIIKENKEK
jgi:fructose-1,6-bisphosphatase-3